MAEPRIPEQGLGDGAAAEVGEWESRCGADRQPWALRWTAAGFELTDAETTTKSSLVIPHQEAERIKVRRRWWRPYVRIEPLGRQPGRPRLTGLTIGQARSLRAALERSPLRVRADGLLAPLTDWYARVSATLTQARTTLSWLPGSTVEALVTGRPALSGDSPEIAPLAGVLSARERTALATTGNDVRRRAHEVNAIVLAQAPTRFRDFFATIESSPLTTEQVHAVIMFDNRVQVVAAAGSGKTAVMIARAAYAVRRGIVPADQILLLAFNKAAATELQHRAQARFAAAGIPARGLRASTFHAFGLDVIGQATGRRPTLAPWVGNGTDQEFLADLVADLRARDAQFDHDWQMFRLLFARVGDAPTDDQPADGWDRAGRFAGLRTFAGDIVRSHGERLVADWLYLHGVAYEYERPYCHPTATPTRRQYHPDFYYPAIDAWHEHWALDRAGNPPREWPTYRDDMAWKQRQHRDHGTDLIETTWAAVMDGSAFPHLAQELTRRGITLAWDPNRPIRGAQPVKDIDVVRLMRTFMTHVKSNALTPAQVQDRLTAGRLNNTARAQMFLRLFWRIHDTWQQHLAQGGYVDFEDMLVQATDHLRNGRYLSPYRLVLVDEFQDASTARADLTLALVAPGERYLLAVGDDWQSINRFAGADLSVFTGFHTFFGAGPTQHLSTTFRCHEQISHAAARFVAKNPAQFRKNVHSVHTRPVRDCAYEGVQLWPVADSDDQREALAQLLTALADAVHAGHITPTAGGTVTVDVLGRYQHDQKLLPNRRYPGLRVAFRTIHAAKGLEADYVLVPNLTTGTYGFPSQITDDPVLTLAMSDADRYEHAEERRLFYVALTRARRGVVLFAPRTTPSPFVTELLADQLVHVIGPHGAPPVVCPRCGQGTLTQRGGRNGTFWSCSTFPRCLHTTNTDPTPASPP